MKYQTVCCTCASWEFRKQASLKQISLPTEVYILRVWTSHRHMNTESMLKINTSNFLMNGPGSSVGIATELWAGWSGIESQWGRDFPPIQTSPGAHPASCKMGTGYFSGVKCGRGMLLTTHPPLVPRSWKSRAIPLPTLWATPGL